MYSDQFQKLGDYTGDKMMKIRFQKLGGALLLSLCALLSTTASWSQPTAGYPNKPVKLLVSLSPGGFNDLSGRLLAQALSQSWGQPVIVENRPGSASILATEMAAKATPDGYTLYLASDGPFVINPFLYKTLPYHPVNDFMPAALVAYIPLILIVNPEKVSAKTLREFVAEARANAGKLDYASAGVGSPHHLSMGALSGVAGVNLNHILYKGGAPALQAVVSGEVAAAFSVLSTSLPYAKAGKLRIIASTGLKRSMLAPDVPTIAESGYPGFEVVSWVGMIAPKGTPQVIVDKIESDVLKIARDPQFSQRLLAIGGEPPPGTAAEFRELIRRDQQRNGKLIRDLNIKPD